MLSASTSHTYTSKMGCTPSKPEQQAHRLSAATNRRNEIILQDSVTDYGDRAGSNTTRPKPAPRKHTLEEIIDPKDIPIGGHVRSPSGNLLDAKQFRDRPDRPRCIRERQEQILQRTRTYSNLAEGAQQQAQQESKQDGKYSSVCQTSHLQHGFTDSFTREEFGEMNQGYCRTM